MAFTYDDTFLTDRDYLRFRIGDTQSAYQKFSDAELDDILTQEGTLKKAIAKCFRILGNDPDRLVATRDGTAGGIPLLSLMQMYANRAKEYPE